MWMVHETKYVSPDWLNISIIEEKLRIIFLTRKPLTSNFCGCVFNQWPEKVTLICHSCYKLPNHHSLWTTNCLPDIRPVLFSGPHPVTLSVIDMGMKGLGICYQNYKIYKTKFDIIEIILPMCLFLQGTSILLDINDQQLMNLKVIKTRISIIC